MMSFCRRIVWGPALMATSIVFALAPACFAVDGPSTFVRLEFGKDVSIEVPRNWVFLDQNIRKHLNTYSEAVA